MKVLTFKVFVVKDEDEKEVEDVVTGECERFGYRVYGMGNVEEDTLSEEDVLKGRKIIELSGLGEDDEVKKIELLKIVFPNKTEDIIWRFVQFLEYWEDEE